MPIRFRCAYCNQLMGIARRKAGTVVRCPKCAGQVVVPTPGPGDDDGPENPQAEPQREDGTVPGGQGGLFERSDFENMLKEGPAAGPQVLQQPALPRPVAANPQPSAGMSEYEAVPLRLGSAPSPRGVFLTSGVLAMISALVVVLMGLAFFLGLLLGRSAGQ